MIDKSEKSAGRWLSWAAWLAAGAIALLLIVGPLTHFITTSASWLNYPYPRPGSEGLILYESLLVKAGGNIYSPITPQSFISGPYPPIYYWLMSALLPNSLPDMSLPGSVSSIFLSGRIVSLLSALVTAALIPLLIIFAGGYSRKGRESTLLAAFGGGLAGALFLTLPQVLVWATRFRGDMLMLAFTAAGLTAVAWGAPGERGTRHKVTPGLALGAVLFALAFFTKQTALAAPLAAASYLLLRDWRVGLKWCAIMGLLAVVPFALLDLATGHWFYLKMVTYHSLPLSQLTLTRLLHFAFWDNEWPLIILAVAYLLYRLSRLREAKAIGAEWKARLLIPLFLLISFAMLPTGAVVGADHNHLLIPGLALCAMAGELLASILNGARASRWSIHIAASSAAMLLLLAYVLFTSTPSSWYNADLTQLNAQEQEQLRQIVLNAQRSAGTTIFSDDAGIVALSGKETPYDDAFTMATLAGQGRWDESAFRDMLKRGSFSLLVLSCDVNQANGCRADIFTPATLNAIRQGYRLLYRDVLFTYVPR